jgi:hypothetical protein
MSLSRMGLYGTALALGLFAGGWALKAYFNPNLALDLASFMQMCAAFLKP